jgi:prepilin-type processing-associated H-X9-DG protein
MKQWALACHNHHDVRGTFPAAKNRRGSNPSGAITVEDGFSANTMLLPFMEQQALYEAILTLPNPWPTITQDSTVGSNGSAMRVVSTLRCPSDGGVQFYTEGANYRQAVTNILTSYGDGAANHNTDNTGNPTTHSNANLRGDISTRGMFYWSEGRDFAFVTDGSSNTILISETVVPTASGTRAIRGGIAWVAAIDGGTASPAVPWQQRASVCMAVTRNSGEFVTVSTAVQVHTRWRAGRYLDGRILYTGFNTIMPPNALSCIQNNSENGAGYYTVNSNHPGGVNAARVDGSVFFVPNSIDTNGLPDAMTGSFLTDASPYGVWGALGTPRGGESNVVL